MPSGFDNIDVTAPAAGDDVSLGDDQIRELKTDILAGIEVEHDGLTGVVAQGRHKFPMGNLASVPATVTRPDGAFYVVSDAAVADSKMLFRNNTGAAAWQQVGTGWLTKIDSSAVVNATTESTITIQAFTAAHQGYEVSAYINGASATPVIFGQDQAHVSVEIMVWIERVKGGNDELHIWNGSASPETVFYRVRKAIVG